MKSYNANHQKNAIRSFIASDRNLGGYNVNRFWIILLQYRIGPKFRGCYVYSFDTLQLLFLQIF